MTKRLKKQEVRRNISRAIYENIGGQGGIFIKTFADKIGINASRLKDILAMKCAVSESELYAIADVIGVSADKIIRGEM